MPNTPPDMPHSHSKACTLCKRIMPVSGFRPNLKAGDGLRAYCVDCGHVKKRHHLRKHNATLLKPLLKSSRAGSVRKCPIFHVCSGKKYTLEITRLDQDSYKLEIWDAIFAREIIEMRDIHIKDFYDIIDLHLSKRALRLIPDGVRDMVVYGILVEDKPPRVVKPPKVKDWTDW